MEWLLEEADKVQKRDLPSVRQCARPILLQGEKAKAAVLGIHGYGGYPGELALPAIRLHALGFTVYVPRLPGHGTSGSDFEKSSRKDWYRCVREAYMNLHADYDQVYVIGHSMGGILALLLAFEFTIPRIVLIAPALKLKNKAIAFTSILSLWKRRIKIAWESDARYPFFDDRDPDDDIYLGKEYWSYLYVKKIQDLRIMQKNCIKKLPKIKESKILTLFGEQDSVVSIKSGEIMKQRLNCPLEIISIPEGTHLMSYDISEKARETVIKEILEWFH